MFSNLYQIVSVLVHSDHSLQLLSGLVSTSITNPIVATIINPESMTITDVTSPKTASLESFTTSGAESMIHLNHVLTTLPELVPTIYLNPVLSSTKEEVTPANIANRLQTILDSISTHIVEPVQTSPPDPSSAAILHRRLITGPTPAESRNPITTTIFDQNVDNWRRALRTDRPPRGDAFDLKLRLTINGDLRPSDWDVMVKIGDNLTLAVDVPTDRNLTAVNLTFYWRWKFGNGSRPVGDGCLTTGLCFVQWWMNDEDFAPVVFGVRRHFVKIFVGAALTYSLLHVEEYLKLEQGVFVVGELIKR